MRLQMLVSAVQQNPAELIEKMNMEADTVLINQCDVDSDENFIYEDLTVSVYNRAQRGVGRSRNLAFEKSDADIVLFSDEDIRYTKGYKDAVLQAFENQPGADLLLFNVEVCEERRTYWNEKNKRVHGYNCGRYPAYSIAARRDCLKTKGIRYSLHFGGGAEYSNGEDSLFLKDCIRGGLKVYTSTVTIGCEEARQSTWFHGFTEKFFYDRGVLFAFLYGSMATLWAWRFVLTKREYVSGDIGRKQALKLLRDGISKGRQLRKQERKDR